MVKLPRLVHVDVRPVHIEQIDVLQLHKLQYLFDFSLDVLMLAVEQFGSNE